MSNVVNCDAGSDAPRRGMWEAARHIGAALACTVCCVGPMLFVTLGLGTSLATWFQPLRPVFSMLAVALLAVGFYVVYRRRIATVCVSERATAGSENRAREKILLWIATVFALLFLTFPRWSALLP